MFIPRVSYGIRSNRDLARVHLNGAIATKLKHYCQGADQLRMLVDLASVFGVGGFAGFWLIAELN